MMNRRRFSALDHHAVLSGFDDGFPWFAGTMLAVEASEVVGMRLAPGERRFDIGNFESYFRAFVEFALSDPRYGADLREFVRSLIDPQQGGPSC